MRTRYRGWLPTLLRTLALSCLLALAGCSVVGSLYTRLDALAAAEAARWLDLDRTQKAAFRAEFAASLRSHQREELPAWIAFLEGSAEQLERTPRPDEVLVAIEASRTLLRESLRLALGPLARTLAGLRPAQVERLAAEMAEANAEYAEEYLDVAPAERARDRRERAVAAVERWSGRLDAVQRARVEQLADAIPDGAPDWHAYRLAWQAELLAALRRQAGAAELQALLETWWVDDAAMEPAYREQLARNRELIATGLAELAGMLGAAQRERAAGRFRDLAGVFAALHTEARNGALLARAEP